MNRILILFSFFLITTLPVSAQLHVEENLDIHTEISKETQVKLLTDLNTLFFNIYSGRPITDEIDPSAFDRSFFSSFKDMGNTNIKDSFKEKPQLINLYPVSGSQYFISLAFMHRDSLKTIINIIATTNGDKIIFSCPLWYLTRNWKMTVVGNITYYYPDSINRSRAKKFNRANSTIAHNLGLPPEQFSFYLCNNYQDALHLMGYEYDSESAGNFRDGYGVDNGIIFSIMHNEDFSHDTFHYYSAKFRKHARNFAADEGVAYLWGNAYYTDEHGEVITWEQLVPKLKMYLQQHPEISLLQLFQQNPLIFGPTSKVRSLLSCLICNDIEKQKGVNGIKILIDCDNGDDNYFRVTNDLVGINRSNFDEKVKGLINN